MGDERMSADRDPQQRVTYDTLRAEKVNHFAEAHGLDAGDATLAALDLRHAEIHIRDRAANRPDQHQEDGGMK